MEKEPWDSSTDRAKFLKIEDFGTPEEVQKMIRPIRIVLDRREAARILKEIADCGPLNNKNGLMVTLSSDSRGKMVSSKALKTSYEQKAHFLAVVNIDKLFFNAIEPYRGYRHYSINMLHSGY